MHDYTFNRFNSFEGASNYSAKFEKKWVERIKHASELRMLKRILRSLPASDMSDLLLDLPCGHGRFFHLLGAVAPRVIEGDLSQCMLETARRSLNRNGQANEPCAFLRASALAMPFNDAAFDLVLSVRLCHHLTSEVERLQYVREILRVTGKWMIFTYLDRYSLKNVVHSCKRRFMDKRPKNTMTQKEVAKVSAQLGFRIVFSKPLSRLFSGQRYTVFQRTMLGVKGTH